MPGQSPGSPANLPMSCRWELYLQAADQAFGCLALQDGVQVDGDGYHWLVGRVELLTVNTLDSLPRSSASVWVNRCRQYYTYSLCYEPEAKTECRHL